MRECITEHLGTKYAEKRGWLVYKLSSPGNRGVPDRLHFKAGVSFAIEYKTTDKKATPKQLWEASRLKKAGIPCRCFDEISDARDFIDMMTDCVDEGDPAMYIAALSQDISSFNP